MNLFGQKLNSRYFNYFHQIYKSILLCHLFTTIWMLQIFIRFFRNFNIPSFGWERGLSTRNFIIIQNRQVTRYALAPAFLMLAVAKRIKLPGFFFILFFLNSTAYRLKVLWHGNTNSPRDNTNSRWLAIKNLTAIKVCFWRHWMFYEILLN
jgi:hypothetical protein